MANEDWAGNWADNPQYQSRIRALMPQLRQVQARYGLPDEAIPYMLANAGIESRWNVNSPRGASNDIGVLQITPILAKDYKAPHTTDVNTQLDVLGQYYRRGLQRGLPIDAVATGWNTGMGRAAQVAAGKRTWGSVTPIAQKYNTAVNSFVGAGGTKRLLNSLGLDYNAPTRTPAVGRTMEAFNIADSGPPSLTANAQLPSLETALLAQPQGVAQTTQGWDRGVNAVTDLQLDGILHTDLGLGEQIFNG